ncbi:MAG: CBS domain-containing protein [Planctomycetota bacterium]|nr:CBS domain-containing protein [Planctomycetota bacterium]MDA1113391.1 CBS domain-containing protein [Planctomycetota bacterium]
MGEFNVTSYRDEDQLRYFTKALLRDLQALEQMTKDGGLENDRQRIGAEQEMFLVDRGMRPANLGARLLETLDDPHFTPELAQFNLECNLDPLDFKGDCLRKLEAQNNELVDKARAAAREAGGDVVLIGILPTLEIEDMTLDNMTANPRYFALNDALAKLRGGPFRLRIKGVDDLRLTHDTIMLEACNTSYQVHLQIPADEFPMHYNIAQLVAAPVMSCAVNSPLLFSKRLWRETRLALFQQSVDTRRTEVHHRDIQPRVSFGASWVKDSVIELYREDIARFRTLIGAEEYEDPFEALEAGRAPKLNALRMHTGTVYRWNRACYGISDGKPHLRIENRLLPAGPSVLDEVANSAFWLGLMKGVANEIGDPRELMDFDDCKNNLLAAARLGLDAQLVWVDGRTYPTHDLILAVLIPIARRGLESVRIDNDDIDRYINVVRERVVAERTGARWQLASVAKMRKTATVKETLTALVHSTIKNQETGAPLHEWPLAEVCETSISWRDQYERISSLMKTDLFTVRETELVDLAANMMDWWHLRHIPVEDDDHNLVGLLTHRVLMRFAFGREDTNAQIPVAKVMDKDPIRVTPDTRTLDAIALMRREKISCLPVVDADNRLVGMITEDILMGIAARLLESKLKE